MEDKDDESTTEPSKRDQHATSADEDEVLVKKSGWMVRPCSVYDAEQWECMKPRGRFYQYYIHGEFADCNVWTTLAKECRKWMKDDITAGAKIIRHEKETVERRVQSRLKNDVWVRRADDERPPVNWNDPLPPHISEKHDGSYLALHAHELLEPLGSKGSWCSIS